MDVRGCMMVPQSDWLSSTPTTRVHIIERAIVHSRVSSPDCAAHPGVSSVGRSHAFDACVPVESSRKHRWRSKR